MLLEVKRHCGKLKIVDNRKRNLGEKKNLKPKHYINIHCWLLKRHFLKFLRVLSDLQEKPNLLHAQL